MRALPRLSAPRSPMRAHWAFKLWFSLILTLILCVWCVVGFAIYRTATDPDGTGRFVGRVIGGAVLGAQEAR